MTGAIVHFSFASSIYWHSHLCNLDRSTVLSSFFSWGVGVTGYIDPPVILFLFSELGWMGWLEGWVPPAVPGGPGVTAYPGVMEGTRSGVVRAAYPLRATGCPRPRWRERRAPLGQTALPQVDAGVASPSWAPPGTACPSVQQALQLPRFLCRPLLPPLLAQPILLRDQ